MEIYLINTLFEEEVQWVSNGQNASTETNHVTLYKLNILSFKRGSVCHRVGEYKNSSFLKLSIKFLEWFPAACTSTCTLKIKPH